MESTKSKGPKDGMVTFSKSTEAGCGIDRVWDVISDVDNDPKYYDGLNSIRNVSKNGNVIEREVVVGIMKHDARQTVTLTPKKSVEVRMTKGPMTGTRITSLTKLDDSKTKIEVSWDVELHVPSFVRSMVKREVVKGTKEALERIVKEAERSESRPAGKKTGQSGINP
jgi:carbon monoxide dehydrogenase subunit G